MTPEELAQHCSEYAREASILPEMYVSRVAEDCAGRILGIGTKYQISPTEQGFERSSVGTMLIGLREEALDLINYAAMVDVLIDRLDTREDEMAQDLLASLREDFRIRAGWAVDISIMATAYVEQLALLGLYTPPAGETYEEQLSSEIQGRQAEGVGG